MRISEKCVHGIVKVSSPLDGLHMTVTSLEGVWVRAADMNGRIIAIWGAHGSGRKALSRLVNTTCCTSLLELNMGALCLGSKFPATSPT